MSVRRLLIIPLCALMLTGCGTVHHDSTAAAMSALSSKLLPSTIAEAPSKISVPHWQVRNPHIFIRNEGGQVVFYSNGYWNGRTIDIYYVPESNIALYKGDYALRETYPVQRLVEAHIVDGQFVAKWNVKGHALPTRFYVLAKTNTGSATIEKVKWDGRQLLISGGESPVQ